MKWIYYISLLVAITTARKLKVNQLVALSAVGALMLPKVSAMITEGMMLFGFSIKNISYAYQVFPAILTILLYAQLEKLFTRFSPKAIYLAVHIHRLISYNQLQSKGIETRLVQPY